MVAAVADSRDRVAAVAAIAEGSHRALTAVVVDNTAAVGSSIVTDRVGSVLPAKIGLVVAAVDSSLAAGTAGTVLVAAAAARVVAVLVVVVLNTSISSSYKTNL